MLFDAQPVDSDQEGRLLHWFLRGGLLGILLLGLGRLLPSGWERFYDLLCPATNSEMADDLMSLSPAGLMAWVVFILASQFVIYGAIALGAGYVTGSIRNRSGRQLNNRAEE